MAIDNSGLQYITLRNDLVALEMRLRSKLDDVKAKGIDVTEQEFLINRLETANLMMDELFAENMKLQRENERLKQKR